MSKKIVNIFQKDIKFNLQAQFNMEIMLIVRINRLEFENEDKLRI